MQSVEEGQAIQTRLISQTPQVSQHRTIKPIQLIKIHAIQATSKIKQNTTQPNKSSTQEIKHNRTYLSTTTPIKSIKSKQANTFELPKPEREANQSQKKHPTTPSKQSMQNQDTNPINQFKTSPSIQSNQTDPNPTHTSLTTQPNQPNQPNPTLATNRINPNSASNPNQPIQPTHAAQPSRKKSTIKISTQDQSDRSNQTKPLQANASINQTLNT